MELADWMYYALKLITVAKCFSRSIKRQNCVSCVKTSQQCVVSTLTVQNIKTAVLLHSYRKYKEDKGEIIITIHKSQNYHNSNKRNKK